MLRKHYLLANIPDQYMRIDWERDFTGSQEAKDAVRIYLDKWEGMKLYGMGLEFGGKSLGVGKTFAATTIGKELIKRRETVFFLPFNQMVNAFMQKDEVVKAKLESVKVLILDELQIPFSDKGFAPISHALESVIRNRTNYNAITIITTNLSEEELEEHYPRIYSLLSAKQMRVEMTGADARQEWMAKKDLELIMNDERRPIT
jgi:DNA replication protein DnaC